MDKHEITWKIVAGAFAVILMAGFGYWAKWISEVALANGDKKSWILKIQAQTDNNKEKIIRIEEKLKHVHPTP